MENLAKAIIIIGSNEGDRLKNLTEAKEYINQLAGNICAQSSIYETAAWGKEELPDHLNQTLIISTTYDPNTLLDILLSIELKMGRVRIEKWGTRIIDLDILFYKDEIWDTEKLTIPHPGIPFRRFTLTPLVEMIPNYIHPTLHKNMQDLLNECQDHLSTKIYLQKNAI